MLTVGLFTALIARSADAAPTFEQRCLATKRKAAATKLAAKLACAASAARTDGSVDPACLLRAETRFTAAFPTTSDCLGDTSAVEASVDTCVSTLTGDVPGTGRCPGAKLRAVGKASRSQLRCLATDALRPGTLVACRDKAASHLAVGLTKAGSCATASSIQADLDSCQAQIAIATPLHADTTTSTSSTTSTSTSTTTSTSTSTSTTPAPVCGNGIVEGNEECDGAAPPICTFFNPEVCAPPGSPQECTCCAVYQCGSSDFSAPCCPGYACRGPFVQPGMPSYCLKTCAQQADCPATDTCIEGLCEPVLPCSNDCAAPAICATYPFPTPASVCCVPSGETCPAFGTTLYCCGADPLAGYFGCNVATDTCM
jgi:hypothetical protein